jgi:hypothetical protein
MNDTTSLRSEIEAYCRAARISPATLGSRAGQGGHFYKRLVEGKRSWPETVEAVRRFMADNPPEKWRGVA